MNQQLPTPRHRRRPRRKRYHPRPRLKFTPTAWAKLCYLRDLGPTEVSGFGLSDSKSTLLVTDFLIIPQCCTEVFTSFDSNAIADFFDDMIDQGHQPEHFARIWIHTHPGYSASPSHIDLKTFSNVFSACDWALMMILARGGETYAELTRPEWEGVNITLDIELDFTQPFSASDHATWKMDYQRCVKPRTQFLPDDFLEMQDLSDPSLDFTLFEPDYQEQFYSPTTRR